MNNPAGSKKNIYLLTEERYLKPKVINNYTNNIIQEDEILIKALQYHGISAERRIWSETKTDWQKANYLMFRTTWDYFERFNEFQNWLNQIENTVPTINSIKTVKWNLDKKYLLELSKKGVRISESELLNVGAKVNLRTLLKEKKWEKAIIKPCVSGAARETYVVNNQNSDQLSSHVSELLKNEAFLFQKFEERVLTKGEVSLMYFGGKFTHAILKMAKAGDFRVQDDFGGSLHEYTANKNEINFGENVLSVLDVIPDYARVDILWNEENDPVLSELELIEPELWFRFNPDSAMVFARLLKNKYF
ncbi:hypothetical protein HZR84_14050 [Hyphobacterium sp. CCMP332]|nr:hypothetical protein HZR84_14050 [Hyphobacterium sp. CCMP332]